MRGLGRAKLLISFNGKKIVTNLAGTCSNDREVKYVPIILIITSDNAFGRFLFTIYIFILVNMKIMMYAK